jgi:hypothetical protein
MARWVKSHPGWLKVLLLALGFALAFGVGAAASLISERGLGFLGEAGSQQAAEQQEETSPEIDKSSYITMVGDIQNGAVETIADSNDKLRRYDSLTPADVDALETNYLTLGKYSDQADNLEPPKGYEEQHDIFGTAIGELYDAAGVAQRLAAKPVSATKADFDEYQRHVDKASTSLRQSNEILDQNYKTTEGLQSPSAL